MRKTWIITTVAAVLAGALLAGLALGQNQNSPSAGAGNQAAKKFTIGDRIPAPEREFTATDGKTYTMKELAGKKGLLVAITCNECPYVIKWDERLVALARQAKEMDFGVVMINPNDSRKSGADTLPAMRKKAEKLDYGWPYVVDTDSRLARALSATRTPEIFLFDAKGRLAYHGAPDDNVQNAEAVTKHYLKDALTAVAAGRPAPTQKTKALGCTIKWNEAVSGL